MRTFVISDTHFGHNNIISHCNRPFRSVSEMDNTIISRWNRVVGKDDIIYFLGDFTNKNPKYYLSRLNGTVFFIIGNHDAGLFKNHIHPRMRRQIITYLGEPILLMHNPSERDLNKFDGWMIHGHTHNNVIDLYPLINPNRKTMNVSCELLNYTPIEISDLIRMRNNLC